MIGWFLPDPLGIFIYFLVGEGVIEATLLFFLFERLLSQPGYW